MDINEDIQGRAVWAQDCAEDEAIDMATIAELEKRMIAGETYLASHANDRKAMDLYNRYEAEYVALKEAEEREQDIAAVWLDLPPGCAYQKAGCQSVHSRVRVLFHGQPEAENEISRTELGELLATRKLVQERR